MSFNKAKDFVQCKRLTEPVYQTPACIQELLDIAKGSGCACLTGYMSSLTSIT